MFQFHARENKKKKAKTYIRKPVNGAMGHGYVYYDVVINTHNLLCYQKKDSSKHTVPQTLISNILNSCKILICVFPCCSFFSFND